MKKQSSATLEKKSIRETIWRLLEEKNVARFPRPVRGRIPNFIGAEEAAIRASMLEEWRRARIVKINPDSPQKPLRLLALRQGKTLIMPSPRLRSGFILIDPSKIPSYLYEKAATIRGAFQLGRVIALDELQGIKIDLIVTGSVAVDKRGHRIGKGEGYAEIEYGIMRELGVVDDTTPIITTVHDLQVVDYIPREVYDIVVDYIVTPKRVLRVENREEKPKGIYWDLLPCKKLDEIPLLRELSKRVPGIPKCRD